MYNLCIEVSGCLSFCVLLPKDLANHSADMVLIYSEVNKYFERGYPEHPM